MHKPTLLVKRVFSAVYFYGGWVNRGSETQPTQSCTINKWWMFWCETNGFFGFCLCFFFFSQCTMMHLITMEITIISITLQSSEKTGHIINNLLEVSKKGKQHLETKMLPFPIAETAFRSRAWVIRTWVTRTVLDCTLTTPTIISNPNFSLLLVYILNCIFI